MNESPAAMPSSSLNVYFIDDSATMREVVKIAFRRESFHVVTCADVASAVGQFEQTRPHAVISDVIMPDRDGYQLCEYVKQHPEFGATPVILLSGVVNREVADKAHQAGADELMRKPFHPQELVACVKKLLKLTTPEVPAPLAQAAPEAPTGSTPNPLSQLFGVPVSIPPQSISSTKTDSRATPAGPSAVSRNMETAKPKGQPSAAPSGELVKLRAEVRRLESLVKKLQSQLDTEREYCASLESQLQSFSVAE